jgi:hypothetical protein
MIYSYISPGFSSLHTLVTSNTPMPGDFHSGISIYL